MPTFMLAVCFAYGSQVVLLTETASVNAVFLDSNIQQIAIAAAAMWTRDANTFRENSVARGSYVSVLEDRAILNAKHTSWMLHMVCPG